MSSKASDTRRVEASFSRGLLQISVTEKHQDPRHGLATVQATSYIRATRRQLERALRRAFKR